ncbi:cell division protein ZipA, partial [Acinetobacter baumannii]
PTLSEPAQSEEKGTKELEQASQAQTVQTQVPVENTPVEVEEVKAEENTVSPTVSENSSVELVDTVSAEPEVVSSSEPKVAEGQPKTEPELSLNPNIETAEIAEFEGESNILDVHLHEQQRFDDESALAMAEQIIALNVYPNPRRALSGDKALKVLLKYGLRYGEMSCFHRYENTDEPSALMFSVLRMTDNGPAGFDLETLSTEQVQGLAFFLALPNSKAVTGFDMMTSIAGLIAREIDGKVYDENNLEFTPQLKEHWRHHVIDYRPAQATA